MSGKARRVPPHAAFCEEYDEIARAVRPETRQVANVSTRRSKNDLKVSEHTVDGASDSGYSSRTAATVNSGQFPPSGRRSPLTQRLDSTTKLAGTERRRESRKDKGKEREDRLPAGEATTMQVESSEFEPFGTWATVLVQVETTGKHECAASSSLLLGM
jgi:hypothetical protein